MQIVGQDSVQINSGALSALSALSTQSRSTLRAVSPAWTLLGAGRSPWWLSSTVLVGRPCGP